MVLYVNACVRQESRTDRLARALINKLGRNEEIELEEIKLEEMNIKPLDHKKLERRSDFIARGNYEDHMFDLAKQFSNADTIVISAPFWDGSFPAILKTYIENIYVTGLVSKYGEDGKPHGLCKAKKLYYVTTAGGRYNPAYSYDYIKYLAVNMLGIKQTELIYSENMDIQGNDAEQILKDAIEALR